MFIKHNNGNIIVLIVYVDDIAMIQNEFGEIIRSKASLAKEFEIKDLSCNIFLVLKLLDHITVFSFLKANISWTCLKRWVCWVVSQQTLLWIQNTPIRYQRFVGT